MKKTSFTTEIAGRTLTAELSDLTEQAGGSVMLYCADTVVLVTAVMSDAPDSSVHYLPLSVEFEEKFYAAGAILGSRFQRREGRPSEEAILSARMIDRTIRPLFPAHLRHQIQIVVTVIAIGDLDPDVLGIIGASLALSISPIPWHGPVGAVRIGRERGTSTFCVNPTYQERAADNLDLELLACGQSGTINMIETAAYEVDEAAILAALEIATEHHAALETFQQDIVAAHGAPKQAIPAPEIPTEIVDLFRAEYEQRTYDTIFSQTAGKRHLLALRQEFSQHVADHNKGWGIQAKEYFETAVDRLLHHGVIHHTQRADGRDCATIRPLYAQAGDVSPVLHGSGIFYRGGTHIFSALTLGGPSDALTINSIESPDTAKRFLHHYNFPPFSVGETGRVGGFNRRMIGHGALAEKALVPVLPSETTFPYTIRVVSETMSSNGSSSMGSVCAASLALMDGGVPISRPVAGIASGVMIDGDRYQLLTDIQGPEDEHGDMDLKVAGTTIGITAIQMDVKVAGISLTILQEALAAARLARLQILEVMQETLASPRTQLSPRAPHVTRMQIRPEQIGLVIGSGGKTVNQIKEMHGAEEISIEDDGSIFIIGTPDAVTATVTAIEQLTKVYAVGDQYNATITGITDFGAFASFDHGNGKGLIHISEIADRHIKTVEEVLAIGDTVPVEIIKNEQGKIGLSIKVREPDFGHT